MREQLGSQWRSELGKNKDRHMDKNRSKHKEVEIQELVGEDSGSMVASLSKEDVER